MNERIYYNIPSILQYNLGRSFTFTKQLNYQFCFFLTFPYDKKVFSEQQISYRIKTMKAEINKLMEWRAVQTLTQTTKCYDQDFMYVQTDHGLRPDGKSLTRFPLVSQGYFFFLIFKSNRRKSRLPISNLDCIFVCVRHYFT